MKSLITKEVRGTDLKVGDRLVPFGYRSATIIAKTVTIGTKDEDGFWTLHLARRHPLDAYEGLEFTVANHGLYPVVVE